MIFENTPAFKELIARQSYGNILDSYSLGVEIENIAPGSEIKLWTLEEPVAGWSIKETRIFDGNNNIVKFNNIFFNSCGVKRFKFSYGNELYSEEGVVEVSPLFVEPAEGSNWDTYYYKLSAVNSSSNDEIFLEIKNSDDSRWIRFERPNLSNENLTFMVPDLKFIDNIQAGNDIEYRFVIGGRNIGPFRGPHITDVFNNMQNPSNGVYTVEIQSERCPRSVCMRYNHHISMQNYTNCNNWQTLMFILDMNDSREPNIELVECDE